MSTSDPIAPDRLEALLRGEAGATAASAASARSSTS